MSVLTSHKKEKDSGSLGVCQHWIGRPRQLALVESVVCVGPHVLGIGHLTAPPETGFYILIPTCS